MADHDYLDHLLATLPDAYRALARQGLYGDFFSFYLCDLFLKLNGKGGQPVYVKVAGQSSGRCAPAKSFSERNLIVVGAVGVAVFAVFLVAALQYKRLPFFNNGQSYSAYFSEVGDGGGCPGTGLRIQGR